MFESFDYQYIVVLRDGLLILAAAIYIWHGAGGHVLVVRQLESLEGELQGPVSRVEKTLHSIQAEIAPDMDDPHDYTLGNTVANIAASMRGSESS